MDRRNKIITFIILTLLVFIIGYYLRSYIEIYKDLAGSPYEIINNKEEVSLFKTNKTIENFGDKSSRYPLPYLLNSLFNPFFGGFYIIFLLGAIIIFLLGREISGSNLGGFLSFSLYCISSENLIQYTRGIGNSGVSYIFIWLSLFFVLKYFKNKKNIYLSFFILSSLSSLISYHTGATAMVMIIFGLIISSSYFLLRERFEKIKLIDKKFLFSSFGLILFYIFWIWVFDFSQLLLIKEAIFSIINLRVIILLGIFIITSFIFLLFLNKYKFSYLVHILLFSIILSIILIFSDFDFFGKLLILGSKNYYISSITLNNYVAQILLTHVYFIILIPIIFKKSSDERGIVLIGWLVGLFLISFGLISKDYYSRILDYSFPLAFILFGFYWSQNRKFRILVVTLTILLLIASQIIIYQDPFTMRRYYNQNEIDSAIKISNLINFENKTVVSDLRTSALFYYIGERSVKFSKSEKSLHNNLFYEYDKLNNSNVDYVILSESMKFILYDQDFETIPLKDKDFEYYRNNFIEEYNDGVMYLYRIK